MYLNSVEAQSPLILKTNPPKSEITLYSGPDKMIGALFLLKDSSILVSNSLVKEDYYNGNYEVAELYIDDINMISYRRDGAGGALLGGVIGLGVGALTAWIVEGSASEPEPSNPFSGMMDNGLDMSAYALLIPVGVSIGALTGGLIGSIKIKIPLNGSMENYNLKKKKLGRHTVRFSGAPKY